MLFKARNESHKFITTLIVSCLGFCIKTVLGIFFGYLNMEKIDRNFVASKKRNKMHFVSWRKDQY